MSHGGMGCEQHTWTRICYNIALIYGASHGVIIIKIWISNYYAEDMGSGCQLLQHKATPSCTFVSGPGFSLRTMLAGSIICITATNTSCSDSLIEMLIFVIKINICVSFRASCIQTTEDAENLDIPKSMWGGGGTRNKKKLIQLGVA